MKLPCAEIDFDIECELIRDLANNASEGNGKATANVEDVTARMIALFQG